MPALLVDACTSFWLAVSTVSSMLPLDVSSFTSIDSFWKKFESEISHIDVLILRIPTFVDVFSSCNHSLSLGAAQINFFEDEFRDGRVSG